MDYSKQRALIYKSHELENPDVSVDLLNDAIKKFGVTEIIPVSFVIVEEKLETQQQPDCKSIFEIKISPAPRPAEFVSPITIVEFVFKKFR